MLSCYVKMQPGLTPKSSKSGTWAVTCSVRHRLLMSAWYTAVCHYSLMALGSVGGKHNRAKTKVNAAKVPSRGVGVVVDVSNKHRPSTGRAASCTKVSWKIGQCPQRLFIVRVIVDGSWDCDYAKICVYVTWTQKTPILLGVDHHQNDPPVIFLLCSWKWRCCGGG